MHRQKSEHPLSVTRYTKKKLPHLPLGAIKRCILGQHYVLSVVFCGRTRAQALNEKYRGERYWPNVLSFPLDAQTGEIILSPEKARREAQKFEMNFQTYLIFLVIHGMLHLKGSFHGRTMEKKERELLEKFLP